jgi:hypothetical protein
MAHFDFDVEFRTDEVGPSGTPIITFELVARISDPIRGTITYPMTVRYSDGMVTHQKDRVNNDISNVQLRRDLISSMKQFVKSQV